MDVWAYLPIFGPVRYSTIITAIVVALFICWRTRIFWLGPLVTLAWASTYEIIYSCTRTLLQGWDAYQTAWVSVAIVGWVLLAYAKGARTDKIVLAAFVGTWVVWILMGFHSNTTMNAFNLESELLNVATKTLLALSYAVGTLNNKKLR
jgi:hypothetical protein